jgi:hypothetical protein
MPGVALLSIIAGYLLWQLWQAEALPRSVRVGVVGFACVWLVLGLGTAARFHLRPALVSLGAQEESAFLSDRLAEPDLRFDWYDDYQALNRKLPSGSRLLIHESRGYYLDHDYDSYGLIGRRESHPERLRRPDYVAEKVHELGSDYVVLWAEPRHMTGYQPGKWVEDSLYALCNSNSSVWPVVYRSDLMVVCKVQPVTGEPGS